MSAGVRIDLNCDLGEGAGHDGELMPWITSANIACGAHAGDASTMRATVELARQHGVAIGAHPGFADRPHFGRRELAATPEDVFQLVRAQVFALRDVARAAGMELQHVKLHGALYNWAARDVAIAEAAAYAVRDAGEALVWFGLAGSPSLAAVREAGLRVASEVCADRRDHADGSLVPRSEAAALITDAPEAVAQVLRLVREGRVRTANGGEVALAADTVCLHGDGAHAVAFARSLRTELAAAGVHVKAFSA